MKIRSAAFLSGLVVSAALLSGCVQPSTAQSNSSPATTTPEIVTPWGGAKATANAANDKFVTASNRDKVAITEQQHQQIDEARIALGILDRMAQRCVQQNNPAACNTLQTNWSTLSQQLHRSLEIISGDNMPVMPSASAPLMSAPTTTETIPGTPQGPTMEKTIPMMSTPSDG